MCHQSLILLYLIGDTCQQSFYILRVIIAASASISRCSRASGFRPARVAAQAEYNHRSTYKHIPQFARIRSPSREGYSASGGSPQPPCNQSAASVNGLRAEKKSNIFSIPI